MSGFWGLRRQRLGTVGAGRAGEPRRQIFPNLSLPRPIKSLTAPKDERIPAMTCDVTRGLLTDYVKCELEREDADGVASHLNSCENCRNIEAEIRKNFGLLRLAPAASPSPDVWSRIDASINRIEAGQEPVRPLARAAGWRVAGVLGLAAAVLVTVTVAAMMMKTDGPAARRDVARVERLGPGVSIFRMGEGGRTPMVPGSTLAEGDTISMDPGAAAIFRMDGVGRFRVSGGSVLRIKGERTLELEKGEVVADITPGGRGFEVRTPEAKAVVLGTLFRVYAEGGRTALTVARGTVTFANARGSVPVGAGSQSSATADGAPSAPLALEASAADWDLFNSVAPGPQVRLEFAEAPAGADVPFTITLGCDASTLCEAGVSERTYVILTVEGPGRQQRIVRLAAGDLTPAYGGALKGGLAQIDREHPLRFTGKLRVQDGAGTYRVTALYATDGRDDSWGGFAESPAADFEVKR